MGGVIFSGGNGSGGAVGSGGSSGGNTAGSSTGGTSATGGSRVTGGAGGSSVGGASGGIGGVSTSGSGGNGAGGKSTGGTGGGTSAGGTTSQGGYNPCPAAGTPCAILALGDSITYGYGSTDLGGYRSQLFALAVTDNRSITFVGGSQDGPPTVSGKTFPKNHEGYSGYTIDQIAGVVTGTHKAVATYKPHIVTLMAGTNDMSQTLDLANAPSRLGKLIDDILADAPNALVVVAKITPSQKSPANTYTQTYNAAIPGIVQTRVSQGKHVVVVDMYTPFMATADWVGTLMKDSVHPKDAGYVLMAKTWYPAISGYLR